MSHAYNKEIIMTNELNNTLGSYYAIVTQGGWYWSFEKKDLIDGLFPECISVNEMYLEEELAMCRQEADTAKIVELSITGK